MLSCLRIWFEFHHCQVKETRILYRIIYNCGRNWYGKVDIFARLLRIFSPWVLGFYFMYLHFQQPSIFFAVDIDKFGWGKKITKWILLVWSAAPYARMNLFSPHLSNILHTSIVSVDLKHFQGGHWKKRKHLLYSALIKS